MRGRHGHGAEGLVVLLLFGVFAISILVSLLSGASVYQRLTKRDEQAYGRRTAVRYVTTRVRQAGGDVTVSPFGDTMALELWEEIGEELCVTRIYCSGGYLRELFSRAETQASPEDGQMVLPADELSFSLEGDLLKVEIAGGGAKGTLILALRGGEETA